VLDEHAEARWVKRLFVADNSAGPQSARTTTSWLVARRNPSNTTTLVINAVSRVQTPIANITGSEEVWFNEGDNRYYLGASRAGGLSRTKNPFASWSGKALIPIDLTISASATQTLGQLRGSAVRRVDNCDEDRLGSDKPSRPNRSVSQYVDRDALGDETDDTNNTIGVKQTIHDMR